LLALARVFLVGWWLAGVLAGSCWSVGSSKRLTFESNRKWSQPDDQNPSQNKIHDLRNGSRPFGGLLNMNTKRRHPRFGMIM
jgi:hypothetical protein